jgi:hypothetical protein
MKKINKSSLSALLIIFGFFVMTLNFWDNPATSQPIFTKDGEKNESLPNTSQFIPRTIRVAIYDDANITKPSYASAAGLTNDYANIQTALLAAGYEVTPLTTNQIYNHELKNARYDVFIMADHLPKTNITNYVKEYWLGGGALLSMDSALCFICYAKILPPESVDDGRGTYWSYQLSSVQNITTRHPVSKSYAINDSFTINGSVSSATFSWSALQGTSIASELVKVATRPGLPDAATVVAYDPQSGGGKVVHLPSHRLLEDDAILIDAIEWLCPRPKGRILFDLSHHPYYGIDSWDITYSSYAPGITIWRDNLVNRSYTLDKLYPSDLGNLTTNNLAPYDVLILYLPDINFTASEISALTNWVNNGGGLITIGEKHGFYDENRRINDLFVNFDLKMNLTDSGSGAATYKVEHPTLEGCNQITVLVPGLVVHSGDSFPILGGDADNIFVGGQEYGEGRIILMTDVAPLRDTQIANYDNLQYGINMINWLTASQAKVLILISHHYNPNPNDNVYKGPVATALNDLGIKFYLTFTCPYFNLSLTNNDFKLVIVDHNFGGIYEGDDIGFIDDYASDVIDYMENGGRIIIRSYRQRFASPLWDYLGYSYTEEFYNSPPVVYIWDAGHRIFTTPAHYNANNITTSLNPFITDFVNVTLYNNATGIAGLTETASVDSNAIILGVNERAISNTFGLTEYYDDTDDSTYPDALEIWENEIAFMTYQSLSVHINDPHTNDTFNATAPDFTISTDGIIIDKMYYTLNDGTNGYISSTSGTLNQGAWDALPDGAVSLKFYVEDTAGSSKYSGVNIVWCHCP